MHQTTQYPFIAQKSDRKHRSYHNRQLKKPETGLQKLGQAKLTHTSLIKLASMNLDSERQKAADSLYESSFDSSLLICKPKNTNTRTQGGHRNYGVPPPVAAARVSIPDVGSGLSLKHKMSKGHQIIKHHRSSRVRHSTEGEQPQTTSINSLSDHPKLEQDSLIKRFIQDHEYAEQNLNEKDR